MSLTSPLRTIKPTGFGTWLNAHSQVPNSKNTWLAVAAIAYGAPDNHGVSKAEIKACGGKFPVHLGVDYSGAGETKPKKGDGTPVYAVAKGTVAHVNGFTGSGDYHVIIQSGSKEPWTALYGHLSSKTEVKKGDVVVPGQKIGYLFNFTADNDTPHLHFGIRKGKYVAGSSSQGFVCGKANGTFNPDGFINVGDLNYVTDYKNFY